MTACQILVWTMETALMEWTLTAVLVLKGSTAPTVKTVSIYKILDFSAFYKFHIVSGIA